MKGVALALTLAVGLAGCATGLSGPTGPTLQRLDGVRIGSVSEPSSFEKRESTTQNFDKPERSNAAKRRKTAFWTGVGMASLGAVAAVGFGVGGRIAQGRLANGYENGDLSRADEDRFITTGKAMNGATTASVGVGLFGVVLLSVAYALDHARCGDLPPKRADCPNRRRKAATLRAPETSAATE